VGGVREGNEGVEGGDVTLASGGRGFGERVELLSEVTSGNLWLISRWRDVNLSISLRC
jgi:hypothetical protein